MHASRILRSILLAAFVTLSAAPAHADGCLFGTEASTPDAAVDGAQFGAAAAIASTDVLVGAPGTGGWVYLYRRLANGTYNFLPTSAITRPAALLSTSGFGSDIAVDNGVAAIGAPFHNDSQGAVVLYQRNASGTWTALQTIYSPVSLPNGNFGFSVAMSGGFLAVGAPAAINTGGFARGVVWIYGRQPNGTYDLVQRIDPDQATAAQDKFFGWSVGLQGNVLVATAPGEMLSTDGGKMGSTYVVVRSSLGVWTKVQRLKSAGSGGTNYGTDLAAGNLGTSGAGVGFFVREQRLGLADIVWKYTMAGASPVLVGSALAGETPAFGGAPESDIVLANSLSINEGFSLIGSPGASTADQYIYGGATWAYDTSYVLPTGGLDNGFGQGVCVGHDQIAIGAPQYQWFLNDAPGYITIRSHDLPDCNADGTPDACAIAVAGLSTADKNYDGSPDGCQLVAAPPSMDASEGDLTTGVFLVWPGMVNATTYQISLATAGGETVLGNAYCAQYLDTTADVGVLRTYRVRSVSPSGALSDGFVAASGWRNVAAPTGVTATDGTSLSNVKITWTASTGATSYKVLRALNGSVTTLGTVTAPTTTYTDTTAVAGTVYLYAVKAVCALGESAASDANAGYRAATAAPTTVAASDGVSSSGVEVVWTAPEGGSTTYTILRQEGSKKPKAIGTASASARTFTDTSGKAAKVYKYYVRLSSATSGGLWDSGWKAKVGPSNAQATDGTLTTGVKVTWSAAPNATKASGYAVYRAVGTGSPILLGSVGKKVYTFTDPSAVPGVLYTYSVRAIAGGLTPASSNDGWRALSPPAALAASDGTYTTKVALSWPNATGATSYVINRTGGTGPVEFVSIANSFDDTTAVAPTVYTYTVKARCALGTSAASVSNTGYRAASSTLLAGPLGGGGVRSGEGAHVGSRHGAGAGGTGTQSGQDELSGEAAWAALDGVRYHLDDLTVENHLFVMGHDDLMVADLRDPLDVVHSTLLVVTDEACLNGGLHVRFQAGYQPALGDRWTLVVADQIHGDFRLVRADNLPAGTRMQVRVVGGLLQLEVVATAGGSDSTAE